MKVLVTGATGKQGGATARALLARGHSVRALCRDAASPRAEALAKLGVERIEGAIQSEALGRAMSGVDAVFAVCTPFEGISEEVRNGFALVDAARKAGVTHLVYTSAANADRDTGIPSFESKKRIEARLRQSGVPFTILGPAYFMENLLEDFSQAQLRAGVFARFLPVDKPLQYVAVEDIARFAVETLEHRDAFLGARIDLAGDELDALHAAAVLSRVLGRELTPTAVPLEQFPAQGELGANLLALLRWLGATGFSADLGRLRREFPAVGWHSLEAWARAQDWSRAAPQADGWPAR